MEQGVLVMEGERERLPEREKTRLAELERVIATDIGAFLRVGAALAEINATRLYREDAFTFEEYLALKWDMGKSQAYRLIDAHSVVENLSPNWGESETLPKNEAQVRPLVKYKDNPELLSSIWSQAVEKSAGKPTAKVVQRTIYEVTGQQASKKTGEVRVGARKSRQAGTVSDEFAKAFEVMLQEIERARNSGYKTSSREEMVRHLDAIRHILSEDGKAIVDPIG